MMAALARHAAPAHTAAAPPAPASGASACAAPAPAAHARAAAVFVQRVIDAARDGLRDMFLPQRELFIFCKRRGPRGIRPEGESRRYTAMALLGLLEQPAELVSQILHRRTIADVCRRLIGDVDRVENLGDVALTLWVANLLGLPERTAACARLDALRPLDGPQHTVELAWALSALCHEKRPSDAQAATRAALAQRLMVAFHARGELFPHRVGGGDLLRGHIGCFADQVYPIQALSFYARCAGDPAALQMADRAAAKICERMGPAGQWWWHYDTRSGRVTEGYPVYSVHQNSMAPMALFAVHEAGGGDYRAYIEKGLAWLRSAPEIGGGSLLDEENRVIWRKVGRREPGKFTRQMQAGFSRLHPALRLPGADLMFPPKAIDWECRPYHLGWVLYTWTPQRVAALAPRSVGTPWPTAARIPGGA